MRSLIFIFFLFFTIKIASAQSNITWDNSMDISTGIFSNMHPRITLDGTGNPMVIWGRTADESVFFSRWNGSVFTAPVKLNPTWLTVATASWMGPDIASKGDTVYIVVKRTPEASDTNNIYIITSYNGGVTFSSPARVDFIADSISRFPTVTTDENGNPIVAFMKFNSSFLDSRWAVSKSSDFGVTFSTDIKASGWSGTNAEVCDCCPGAIVSNGNYSAVLYRDNLNNIRDIWAGLSTDNNVSYNSGFATDNNNWMLMSCPASGPDGVIYNDSLYTVFMSGGSGSYRTYLSKSAITSGALNTVSPLTGNLAGLGVQNYPRIAVHGNAMAIVWVQTLNGTAQLPVSFTNNISNGFPVAYDTVDVNEITNCDVALGQTNIHVVWQDGGTGTVKYRKGTYIPDNTGTNSVIASNQNYIISPNPSSACWIVEGLVQNKDMKISLFDSMGKLILDNFNFEHGHIKISNVELKSGVYFLRVKTVSGYTTIKLLKN